MTDVAKRKLAYIKYAIDNDEETYMTKAQQRDFISKFKSTFNISHHGILGMRWGIRRLRGPDGRRTGPEVTTEQYQSMSARERAKKFLRSVTGADRREQRAKTKENLTAEDKKKLTNVANNVGRSTANRVLDRIANEPLSNIDDIIKSQTRRDMIRASVLSIGMVAIPLAGSAIYSNIIERIRDGRIPFGPTYRSPGNLVIEMVSAVNNPDIIDLAPSQWFER